MGCTLWAVSEIAYYRSAYFGSTETLGFFFALTAFAFYQRKKYLFVLPFLALSVLSHLLPPVFIVGVMFADQFVVASNKRRVIVIVALIVSILLFYSPLNPHQRLVTNLSLANLLAGLKLSNLWLYSFGELLQGLIMFGGLVSLGCVAVYSWVYNQRNRLMDVYFIVAVGLFAFSWINYMPNVFSPPRLTYYFLIPFIYYAVKVLDYKRLAVLSVISLISISILTPIVLFTGDALTREEYLFIDNLNMENFTNQEWFVDYPLRVSLRTSSLVVNLTIGSNTTLVMISPTISLNTTQLMNLSLDFLDPLNPRFKMVLLTPRMSNMGLYFVFNEGRTIHVRKPIEDYWADNPLWELIKEENGIKLYRKLEK